MTEWEPATEAEVAMRDALRANDQELYFRLLSRTDLLLPVSTPAGPGQSPAGWGTWTTGGRTHVLAFTSAAALRACLGDHAGSNRRVPFTDLALGWPNHEWWLAVNPGLPVEGYLPAWFVSQLSRGDVRLPGRAMGARARLERAETLARTRAGATGRDVAPAAGSTPSASDPAAAPSGRPSPRGAVPPVVGPTASGLGELSHRSGVEDMPAAGQRHPTGPPRPSRPGVDPAPSAGRAVPSRYAPLASPDHGVAPADHSGPGAGWPPASRPGPDGPAAGNGSAQGGRRSFFEPTSGRDRAAGPASGDVRPADRAAPPSRFGRGSQPFPRRRPADAPGGDGATRAFPMPPPDALRPPAGNLGPPRVVRAPAADDETTQPLPPRRPDPLAEEPTRAFRVPGPAAGEPPSARAARSPSPTDETQAFPHDRSADPRRFTPAEELPPSVAEPVSGPPAPRRGFTPIVIEGTIIESRDLTDPTEAAAPASAGRTPGSSSAPPSFGPPFSEPSPSRRLVVVRLGVSRLGVSARPSDASAPGPDTFGQPTSYRPSVDDDPATARPDIAEHGVEDGQRAPADGPAAVEFDPANTVEEDLLGAAGAGSTDTFLSTLLLARVLLPVGTGLGAAAAAPGDPGFVWRTEQLDGETYVVVYTSPERLADHVDGDVDTVRVKFAQLIRRWPDRGLVVRGQPGHAGRGQAARRADRRAGQLGRRGGSRRRPGGGPGGAGGRAGARCPPPVRPGGCRPGPTDGDAEGDRAQPARLLPGTGVRPGLRLRAPGRRVGSPDHAGGVARRARPQLPGVAVRPGRRGDLRAALAGASAQPLPDPVRRAERAGDAGHGGLGHRASAVPGQRLRAGREQRRGGGVQGGQRPAAARRAALADRRRTAPSG